MPIEGWIVGGLFLLPALAVAYLDGTFAFLKRRPEHVHIIYVQELTPWEQNSSWCREISAVLEKKKAAEEPTPPPPNSHPGDAR